MSCIIAATDFAASMVRSVENAEIDTRDRPIGVTEFIDPATLRPYKKADSIAISANDTTLYTHELFLRELNSDSLFSEFPWLPDILSEGWKYYEDKGDSRYWRGLEVCITKDLQDNRSYKVSMVPWIGFIIGTGQWDGYRPSEQGDISYIEYHGMDVLLTQGVRKPNPSYTNRYIWSDSNFIDIPCTGVIKRFGVGAIMTLDLTILEWYIKDNRASEMKVILQG